MKIVFCGTNLPESLDLELHDLSLSGNRFQNNIYTFIKMNNKDIFSLNYIGYPIESEKIELVEKAISLEKDKNYVFKNGNIIKSMLMYRKQLKKILKEANAVIAYNVCYPWLLLPFMARHRKCKSVVILADYSGAESYKSLFMKLFAKVCLFDMRNYDLVVGLSSNIKNKLTKKQKFICVEGGINLTDFLTEKFKALPQTKNEKIRIMYSGALKDVTGVDLFLDAIKKIKNPDIEFIFSGKGVLENEIIKQAKKDKRIIFKGSMPYEEYLSVLSNAHILINPRNMNMPENQNNFPSKYMEYLASGRVLISTKFAGFEKFLNTAFFCESTSEDLAKTIEETIDKYNNVYQDIFTKNRDIAQNYDFNEQMKKILKEIPKIN